MASAKPITLTQADTWTGDGMTPQPMVLIGDVPSAAVDLTDIADYDAGETQVLKNISGTLTWVTEA